MCCSCGAAAVLILSQVLCSAMLMISAHVCNKNHDALSLHLVDVMTRLASACEYAAYDLCYTG